MSHFTVAVFTESHNTDIESMLLPYMENCCETPPKQYMEFEDAETQMEDDFANGTQTRVKMSDGRYLLEWDEEFRIPGTFGIGTNTHKIPDDCEVVEIPVSELYTSLEQYALDWYGMEERDAETGRYGYWENPNAKWDWYQIGGRWAGMLIMKDESENHVVGNKSCGGGYGDDADGVYVRNIDFEKMREEAKKNLEPFAEARKTTWYKPEHFDELYPTEERYIKKNTEFSTFAVVTPDGEWHEKGTMGWWGCSSETPEDGHNWSNGYEEIFIKPAIENNWFMTIVDCHI